MKRRLPLLLCTWLSVITLGFAQNDTVYIDLSLDCIEKKLLVYDYNGFSFLPYQNSFLHNDSINAYPLSKEQFIYVGLEKTQKLPFIGTPGDTVRITGTCKSIRAASVKSPTNDKFAKLSTKKKDETKAFGQNINKYRAYFRDSSKLKSVIAEMAELDLQRLNYFKQLKEDQPFLAAYYGLDLYLSYQNHGGKYENEIDYFINEYFSYVDFSSDYLNRMPSLYESMTRYVSTTEKFVKEPVEVLSSIETQLEGLKKPSKAHQIALGAIISASKKDHIEVYIHYAEEFLTHYGKLYPQDAQRLKTEMKELKKLMIGQPAPDLRLTDPEGKAIKLSDLTGNVVLLDFWASWCGPCRRENPNVRRVYDEFKDKGFDVVSVSLDKDKGKWIQAIEKDGLEWHHMSDLKGWSSVATKVYNIKAIPRTYLLDSNGIIMAKNLRGDALYEKVSALISEQ